MPWKNAKSAEGAETVHDAAAKIPTATNASTSTASAFGAEAPEKKFTTKPELMTRNDPTCCSRQISGNNQDYLPAGGK